MQKYILRTLLGLVLVTSASLAQAHASKDASAFPCEPLANAEAMAAEMPGEDLGETNVEVKGAQVFVTGAEGMVLDVFDITGKKRKSLRIDSNSKTVSLADLGRGLYIVKVGNVSRRVVIS